ncbi:hypothetical protein BGZ70_004833, partial [Mortierella alpina]
KDDIQVLEYSKVAVLEKTSLTRTKLTALACVFSNDYNKNIRYLGIETNCKVFKDLSDGGKKKFFEHGVPSSVRVYLESPLVIRGYQIDVDFTASILVFTTMTHEIAAAEAPTSNVPLIDQAALPKSLEELCQQYKSIKDQYEEIKAQRRVTSRICKYSNPSSVETYSTQRSKKRAALGIELEHDLVESIEDLNDVVELMEKYEERHSKNRSNQRILARNSPSFEYVWNHMDKFHKLSTLKKSMALSGIVDLDVHANFPEHARRLLECKAAVDRPASIRDRFAAYQECVDDYGDAKEARFKPFEGSV